MSWVLDCEMNWNSKSGSGEEAKGRILYILVESSRYCLNPGALYSCFIQWRVVDSS